MSSEDSFDWYVVRCFSSHEKKVKEYLTREIEEQGLEHKINEILIPTETVIEIRSGKKTNEREELFSRLYPWCTPVMMKR
jgi:transcription termination/antitermination protein NusG